MALNMFWKRALHLLISLKNAPQDSRVSRSGAVRSLVWSDRGGTAPQVWWEMRLNRPSMAAFLEWWHNLLLALGRSNTTRSDPMPLVAVIRVSCFITFHFIGRGTDWRPSPHCTQLYSASRGRYTILPKWPQYFIL